MKRSWTRETTFRTDFGDMEGWDASIRGMLNTLVDASRCW
jgi:hypothetical protein